MDLPVVGVRDKNLNILGYLDFGSVALKVYARFNNVGAWELQIPVEHPLADLVRAPGSGIVCFFNGRVISGWTRSAVVEESASDPEGSWTISGVTDEVLLAARETLPNPSKAADSQDTDYYVDSGSFEAVAKDLVDKNLGGSALVDRQLVSVKPELGRGANVKISSRFKNVLEELQVLAVAGGDLGFHVFQENDQLWFDVYEPVDRTREIQLDVDNGGLESAGWGYEAPSVSKVLVAGQGSGAERTIKVVSTPESDAAAVDWGFSVEEFKDQRNTDDEGELVQAGLKILSEGGMTGRVISMKPSGSPALKPGAAYWLGDLITVASSAGAAQAQVTEVLFSVTDEGLTELVSVGDPVGFEFESRMKNRVEQQDRRITQLERSAEGGSSLPAPSSSGLVLFSDSNLAPKWDSLPGSDYRVVPTEADKDNIPNPYHGLRVFVQSTNREYVWRGSWKLWSSPEASLGLDSATGFCYYSMTSGIVYIRFDISKSVVGDTPLTDAIPAEFRPLEGIVSVPALFTGSGLNFPTLYLAVGSGVLRATASGSGSISRVRGQVTYPRI